MRDEAGAGAVLLAHAPELPWIPIAGRPLLAWAAQVFDRMLEVQETALVVAPERLGEAHALAVSEGWTHIRALVPSGPRRRDALHAGLAALALAHRWVVLHDAARPLVTAELIAAGLSAAQQTGAASAAVPVKETIKRVRDGTILQTLDRTHLALLQTPQVFDLGRLEAAYANLPPDADPPDAATVAAAAGLRIAPFPGDPENIAVATPADLLLAKRLLHARHGL